jgi:hypothetical protein
MTYAAIAEALFGQRPRFLYCFDRAGIEYRFTVGGGTISKAVPGVVGTVWASSSISHPRVPNSAESARAEFRISLALSDPLSQTLLAPIGIVRTRLRIWKYFENDPDGELVVVYSGSLLNIQPKPGRAGSRQERKLELVFVQSQNELNRKGLIRVAQRPCTWVVYGRGCRLNADDFKDPASVTGVSTDGLFLTVPAVAAEDPGLYRAALIYWGPWSEMILGKDGDQIELAAPLPGLVAAFAADGAQAVQIAPGCDLTLTTCNLRFSNDDNHGGLPNMSDTPFDGRSIV